MFIVYGVKKLNKTIQRIKKIDEQVLNDEKNFFISSGRSSILKSKHLKNQKFCFAQTCRFYFFR